jgi:hypothetical protein
MGSHIAYVPMFYTSLQHKEFMTSTKCIVYLEIFVRLIIPQSQSTYNFPVTATFWYSINLRTYYQN